jgi:aromatic ring-opening dioxygenase catalytic subunit (LigB family)
MTNSMPSLFISHGAPSIAIEQDDFTRAVAAFGDTLHGARAVVIVSAHWQARGVRVNAVAHPETIYDFGGFSDDLYKIRYEAPGDPALGREISTLLGGAALEETRGWDHGLWVPMRILLPDASIPIVEIAQPHPTTPADLLRIGQALAPLRDRGVVIAGIVHTPAPFTSATRTHRSTIGRKSSTTGSRTTSPSATSTPSRATATSRRTRTSPSRRPNISSPCS